MEKLFRENKWEILTRYLQEGWEVKAKELGVLKRARKFKSASDILRVELIHLVENSSLKISAAEASAG